ncbi:hypothetical protein ACQBAT_02320 [Ornithinimicrobium sp. Y1847]|uniref:hypothetical protein n=1 Tax=Ornithinimicrobium sp. Y1847 TaxID=3405419 RepID=UPI003B67306F
MSIVPPYVLATRAPQPGTGACDGIGAITAGGIAITAGGIAVTAGGVASIPFATIVLAAVLLCGCSQQGTRLLDVHGPGDASAPGHPQTVATTGDGDPDGAGA